jgi:hypothetical protein
MIKGLKAFHIKGDVERIVFGKVLQETPHFYAIQKISKVHGEPKAVYNETVSKFDVKYIEDQLVANRRLAEV